MEHAIEGLGMGAAAAAAAAALFLAFTVLGEYGRLLDVVAVKLQQNPVVECAYE